MHHVCGCWSGCKNCDLFMAFSWNCVMKLLNKRSTMKTWWACSFFTIYFHVHGNYKAALFHAVMLLFKLNKKLYSFFKLILVWMIHGSTQLDRFIAHVGNVTCSSILWLYYIILDCYTTLKEISGTKTAPLGHLLTVRKTGPFLNMIIREKTACFLQKGAVFQTGAPRELFRHPFLVKMIESVFFLR